MYASAWLRAGAILAAVGATLGSALDGIHTRTGVTSYPDPWIWKMAWWTPLLFAGAGVAIGMARPLAQALLRRPAPGPTAGRRWLGMALFVSAYALSGLLPLAARPWALGAIVVLLVALCERTTLGLMLAVLTAVGGCAVEITLVGAGAFTHTQTELWGVPVWLPLLYASASLALGNLGVWLVD